MNNKKKIMYIGILALITVIVSITYFSYAFLTQTDVHNGKLNIVVGTLTYRLKIDNQEANTTIVPANGTKEIEVKVKSLNSINSKFELYYLTINGVDVNYLDDNDVPSGTLSSDEEKTITVILTNNTNTNKEVTLGVMGSLMSNNIELASNMNSLTLGETAELCSIPIGTTYDFAYTGNVQTFTPSCKGKYKVELWGAQGGSVCYSAVHNGGAYTSGTIKLDTTNTLNIYVGNSTNTQGAAAYNGGGIGYASNYGTYNTTGAYSGGGATDVRYGSTSLNARIMVAAGGGGRATTGSSYSCDNITTNEGGPGGGLQGYVGSVLTNYGGSQASGGICNYSEYCGPGSFGQGGNSIQNNHANGGGGGGYYGGADRSAYMQGTSGLLGGGSGSSFISGHEGCIAIQSASSTAIKTGCDSSSTSLECSKHYSGLYFTNTKMIDGYGYSWTTTRGEQEQMPNPNGGYYATGKGRPGTGYARITYLGNGGTVPGTSWVFDYTGSEQEFNTPKDGTYKIELWGAQGGAISDSLTKELGGYTSGLINLPKNNSLYIYVGEKGVQSNNNRTIGAYNGGGSAYFPNTSGTGGLGGGATDVRLTGGIWSSFDSLKSRIMVAGGAGGVGYEAVNTNAGAAGGLTGYDATPAVTDSWISSCTYGLGGTQTTPGNWGNSSTRGEELQLGGFGYGGNSVGQWNGGGSGGGGYYGGAGGQVVSGGGGSSFISGYSGCNAISESSTSSSIVHTNQPNHYSGKVFTNAVMIDGKGCNWSTGSATNCGANQPQPNGTNAVGHSGNGYAKITYLGYRINLDSNGGNIASSTIYTTGTLGELPTPTKTGYVFTGWVDDNNNTVNENTSARDIPNYNLTATYRPITYKVRFNANGGSGNMADETFTYDQAKALSSNGFSRSGKTFLGWSTVSGNQLLYYSATEKVSTNNEFMQYGVDLSPYFNTYGIRDYSMMLDIKSANISKANYQVVYCQNGNGSQWGWNNVNFIVSTSYQTFDFSFVPIKGNNSYTTSQLALYGVYNTGNYPSVKNVYLFLGKFYRNSKQISNLTATDGEIIDLYAVWR